LQDPAHRRPERGQNEVIRGMRIGDIVGSESDWFRLQFRQIGWELDFLRSSAFEGAAHMALDPPPDPDAQW
jgi:hypothetical protein